MIATLTPAPVGNEILWLDTDEALRDFCEDLTRRVAEGEPAKAYIDTEADSLHHFQEKLCLIQIASCGRFALIDPLAIKDISPLLNYLEKTELWLHGADYDLTLLKRTYGWMPARIHDTQVAARLTGHRAFGLAALVVHYTGVTLCKSSQKEDWSRRPLPAKMQAYAIDDVRYLRELATCLVDELEEKHRMGWFAQSCDSLRQDVMARQERDREDLWRINGSGKLHAAGLAMLRELWLWREGMARERDVPPFRILNNQQMLTMAADWEHQNEVTIPPRWRGKWRESFEVVIENLRRSDPESWPTRPKHKVRRSTEEERSRIDQLCRLRDQKAGAIGLESSLLGSRALMEDLVLRPEANPLDRLLPWQKEVLGDALHL